MSYTHLTPTERGQVQALVQEGKGVRYIADVLGRSPATISRERKRHAMNAVYCAQKAQQRYHERRKACRPARKLDNVVLWRSVYAKGVERWAPEQIAQRLRLDYPDDRRMRISHETIYREIYADERLAPLKAHLRQARPKRRKRGQGKARRCCSIPNRISIHERPKEVDERSRFGDWEGDTVLSKEQRGAIVTLVDRASLLLRSRKVETKQADEVAQAVIHALEEMPNTWVRTITFDNGCEFARHQDMTAVLNANVYFADAYASWQRGLNENTNGLLRQYLPKGSSFEMLTQAQLDAIVEEINNRPRKKLGYRTPNEVYREQRQQVSVALRT